MKRILSILFLLALSLSACAPAATEAPARESTQVPQPIAAKGLFQIVKADGTTFNVTLDTVKALPLAQITVEGKVQEGPKLLDILALAGVTDFTEVTFTGSSAPNTLTYEQVVDSAILDFSNRGTMKLATTYIPKAEWTKDITQITVK
jgi:hypothetical protein